MRIVVLTLERQVPVKETPGRPTALPKRSATGAQVLLCGRADAGECATGFGFLPGINDTVHHGESRNDGDDP